MHAVPRVDLPDELDGLHELALDLRWTWNHAGDALWRALSADAWERFRNPWLVLQEVPRVTLERLAGDRGFLETLRRLMEERRRYLRDPGWCARSGRAASLGTVAYFSMEFGLSDALPLYAGGLGVLAGDYLKTASDLGVPLVAAGLLYVEGYFRQVLDVQGQQQESYPYSDPASLPIEPARTAQGAWLRIPLPLPGRTLWVRVWRASVGRVTLYLLDTNDPWNSAPDRGITSTLYGGGTDQRFLQEFVLGVAGWRALEALGVPVTVCHLNEGHAAFVTIERARRFMADAGVSFWDAWWATRAGNVFTTHTPIPAGFDRFPPDLVARHLSQLPGLVDPGGIPSRDLLALGREHADDAHEPFSMAHLAMRGCASANGVSRLHGAVSRRIFQALYPRWPEPEIPVRHVTNGVHMPSWDSAGADALWSEACGKERWRGDVPTAVEMMERISDSRLWEFRTEKCLELVRYARDRLARQVAQQGASPEAIARARNVLDPAALTLGFARRMTEYKRPTLLLRDRARLIRLLSDPARPVQIIVAGKAHPADAIGKQSVRAWTEFAADPAVEGRAIFLEDYDMTLAQELVQGVDVWLNTPRRPWEACGTSGMKVLVNGGLNLSALDGWWDEAYAPDLGWALNGREGEPDAARDEEEATQLYRLLEEEVVREFYTRDEAGLPRVWLARMRASMARLAPQFSGNRMMREYVDGVYRPAAEAFRRRAADGAQLAKTLRTWWSALGARWPEIAFGPLEVREEAGGREFEATVALGAIDPAWVAVELYAPPGANGAPAERVPMALSARASQGGGRCRYRARVVGVRPPSDYTPRVIPYHPEARVPGEAGFILWQR